MNINRRDQYLILINLNLKFSLSRFGAVMSGLAVNRQPGFRRGLVEQSNAAKNNPAVGWLADCLLLLAATSCRLLAGCGGWLHISLADRPAHWVLPAWLVVCLTGSGCL